MLPPADAAAPLTCLAGLAGSLRRVIYSFFPSCSPVIYVVFCFFCSLLREFIAGSGRGESWRVAAPPTRGRGSPRDGRAAAACRPPSGAAHTPRRQKALPISRSPARRPQARIDTSACASFVTTTMCNLVTCHGQEAARSFW